MSDSIEKKDLPEALQSDGHTAAAETKVDPLGTQLPAPELLGATTFVSCDPLDGVAHALDDMAATAPYLSCDALESVGYTLDHLISVTDLFDVPPFDLDSPTGY